MATFQMLRKAKGYSQTGLAEELGVDQSAISLWESGKTAPRLELAIRVCTILGCTLDELYGSITTLIHDSQTENQVAVEEASGRLQIFNHPDFGRVRTVTINDNPWFVGKDAAQVLGYSNPSKAVISHVDDEDKRFEMLPISDSQNGNLVKTAIINESGLYSLILSSKLPRAKEFKRWVTSEVLPAIRKTGAYRSETAPDTEKLIRCAEIMGSCLPENRQYVLNILRQVIPGIEAGAGQASVAVIPETIRISRYGSCGKNFDRKALVTLCKAKGYGVSYISRKLGCSVSVVSRWMGGQTRPCPEYRERLCDLFGVPMGYFDL